MVLLVLPASPAQAQQPDRERDPARFWFGTALLSVGSMTATYTAGTACSDAYVPTTALTCSHKWGQVGSLAGIAVLGAFFATVWADVPLARNFSVRATDSGGVQMAAAFRF